MLGNSITLSAGSRGQPPVSLGLAFVELSADRSAACVSPNPTKAVSRRDAKDARRAEVPVDADTLSLFLFRRLPATILSGSVFRSAQAKAPYSCVVSSAPQRPVTHRKVRRSSGGHAAHTKAWE